MMFFKSSQTWESGKRFTDQRVKTGESWRSINSKKKKNSKGTRQNYLFRIRDWKARKWPLLITNSTSLTAWLMCMIHRKYSLGLPCSLSSSSKSYFAETELWYGDWTRVKSVLHSCFWLLSVFLLEKLVHPMAKYLLVINKKIIK